MTKERDGPTQADLRAAFLQAVRGNMPEEKWRALAFGAQVEKAISFLKEADVCNPASCVTPGPKSNQLTLGLFSNQRALRVVLTGSSVLMRNEKGASYNYRATYSHLENSDLVHKNGICWEQDGDGIEFLFDLICAENKAGAPLFEEGAVQKLTQVLGNQCLSMALAV